jgi:hypothetical protein
LHINYNVQSLRRLLAGIVRVWRLASGISENSEPKCGYVVWVQQFNPSSTPAALAHIYVDDEEEVIRWFF